MRDSSDSAAQRSAGYAADEWRDAYLKSDGQTFGVEACRNLRGRKSEHVDDHRVVQRRGFPYQLVLVEGRGGERREEQHSVFT